MITCKLCENTQLIESYSESDASDEDMDSFCEFFYYMFCCWCLDYI